MTYIVAFVKFPLTDNEYNVNCFRTDIIPGDAVLIKRGDGIRRPAIVSRLEYYNWDCKGLIECKLSEAVYSDRGIRPPTDGLIIVGLVGMRQLIDHLRTRQWTPTISTNRTHSLIMTKFNGKDRALIWLRRHGIDLQVIDDWKNAMPNPNSYNDIRLSDEFFVRHYLAGTKFNLYEGIARFADDFTANTGDYDKYFRSVGDRDRRNSELREKLYAQRKQVDNHYDDTGMGIESILYDALGGDGSRSVYLGDGLYLGSDGSWQEG